MTSEPHRTDPVDVIHKHLPLILPDAPPLHRISPVLRNQQPLSTVWQLTFTDGSKVIVKKQVFASFTRGKLHHILTVEKEVCDLLTECALPKVYGSVEDQDLIFLEWCGDHTLDDILQDGDDCQSRFYTQCVINAYSQICSELRRLSSSLSRRVFPGCGIHETRSSWQALKSQINLSQFSDHFGLGLSRSACSDLETLLHRLMDSLADAEPHLGPTDYNARNIVLDTKMRSARFIEFSKLGWDWPERRLTQYVCGSGAGITGGTFKSALNTELCAGYADLASQWACEASSSIQARLDGHHFIYHLVAATKLLEALSSGAKPHILDLWQRPEQRLEDLYALLAFRLSRDEVVGELRTNLG